MFPILGGRLLKCIRCKNSRRGGKFPILGGRLLKIGHLTSSACFKKVSNPWREAIEGELMRRKITKQSRFQSLEGGY